MNLSAPPHHAFTIKDFCRSYAIGRTSVYAEIAAGRLQTRKVGRRTIILCEDAESWVASLPMGASADRGGLTPMGST